MPRYNPFKPGSIVTTGMFCGRVEELKAIERALFQTKNANPHHFLIHGERGIGKSSLMFVAQCLASGDIGSLESGNFRFLTVSIELEPTNSYREIIRKIGAELQRVVAAQQRAKELLQSGWEFLKRWEVMGVKYTQDVSVPEPHELLDELTHTIEATMSALGSEFDGILILIDEADKPPHTSNLGEFVKIFTERLAKRGCNGVAIGLAGQSSVLDMLRRSHESSPRIFEVLTLEPLLSSERIDVIHRGLDDAKQKNGFEVSITSEAADLIATLSEGYPHFIQQYAYSAFEADKDNVIDVSDVLVGSTKENGALAQLGLKYFHDLYFDQIGSDEYREVLRAMSDKLDNWATKKDLRKATKMKDSTLNNAINALKTRNIILCMKGKKGVYRLPTKSFAVWIKGFTKSREAASSGGIGA